MLLRRLLKDAIPLPLPLTVKRKVSGYYCRQMRTGTFSEKKNFQDPEPGYRRCAEVTSTERRIFLYSCTMRIIFWHALRLNSAVLHYSGHFG